mgnify:CR=1 FL=1
MNSFFRQHKASILWITCTVLVLICCGVYLLLAHPWDTETEPSSVGQVSDPSDSSDPADPGSSQSSDRTAVLDSVLYPIAKNTDIHLTALPRNLSRSSPWQDCVQYVTVKTSARQRFRLPDFTDPTSIDPSQMIWIAHVFLQDVAVDPTAPEAERHLFPFEMADSV